MQLSNHSLQIGIAGVALSHPYTFTEILQNKGIERIHVWDDDLHRLEAFCNTFPDVVCHEKYENLLMQPLSGVMICTESCFHTKYSIPFIEKGIPLFIDKVMSIVEDDLNQLIEAVQVHRTPVFSASILRFSPYFTELSQRLKSIPRSDVLAATSYIFHTIEGYLREGNTWQDEIHKGGGTLINMGVHGVELMFSALGTGVSKVHATTSKRYFTASQSEDVAVIQLAYRDGLLGTVHLICGTKQHGYRLDVYCHEGQTSANVPIEGDLPTLVQYGYVGLVDAFLDMIHSGDSPVQFDETCEIVRVLLAARMSSEAGDWVELNSN
jgi:predicted dehydrogenase